ncbi:hypothetical protein BYT27DRAFT_7223192 [Phlegmacium glaucopus]|nr:hypothetical protein BYT27DRAFT_7223192 [Phlegmacium glaucopus]
MSVHHDIYRGEPSQQQAPSIISTSSSSASSVIAAGRLGVIAAKVELAISRWAKNVRGNSSASSDSSSSHSSSSSSNSSIVTLTKSQQTRQRSRRSSHSSLRTLQSDRDIAARILRMKALEEFRRIPRQFALYLPPSIIPKPPQNQPDGQPTGHPFTSSTSLPLVLNQLDLAIKKAKRNRRLRQRRTSPQFSSFASLTVHDNQSDQVHLRAPRGRKGKHRESPTRAKSPPVIEGSTSKPQAWFLDVANPSWADLHAIGKLLHIHPLTLEDILQQDPREKLELFTNLGYYFISFRAIESRATKERLQRETADSGNNWNLDEGSLGEANVYLTVFDDGICCFHFTDVSEHIDRVRNRMVLLQEVVNMSSDWIAHDILDSIVDSFFPFLENIETEAMAIDNIIFSGYTDQIIPAEPPKLASMTPMISGLAKRVVPPRTNAGPQLEEKYSNDQKLGDEKSQYPLRPRFVAPRLTVSLAFHRMKRSISNAWKLWTTKAEPPPTPSQLTLRRIGSTRKVTTSLVRLLATKSDVLTAFRKRLMRVAALKAKSMTGRSSDDLEIAIYSGDVQDHILTLQHALVHYERVLSQLNPIYVSQLRAEVSTTKNTADVNLLYLTTVAVCCATVQIMIGLLSLNIHIPHNRHAKGSPFFVFGIVLSLSAIIVGILLWVIRHWWKQSKRRRRQSSGVNLL